MGLLNPDQRISTGIDYTPGDNVNTSRQVGEVWRPTFKQVRAAEGRLNNALDAYEHRNDSPEQKKAEEDEARDLLSYASFGQQIRATFSQDEVLLGTLASLVVPPIAMNAIPATLGRVGAAVARVGVAAGANAGLTAGKETALHAMQETRTLQESAYTVAGAAVLGAGFQGVFDGAGAALSRRASVGPNEQAARQAFIDNGTTAEHELGKAVFTPDPNPIISHNGMPMSVRHADLLDASGADSNIRIHSTNANQLELFDDPLTHGLSARPALDPAGIDPVVPDHSIGAAYAQPGQMLARGHDVPATAPFEHELGKPIQYALDSTSPIATGLITSIDRGSRKVFGQAADGTMTHNSYMLVSENQSTRALAADLLPLNTATRLSESGAANPMALGTKVESYKHGFLDKLDVHENARLIDYKQEWAKMSVRDQQHFIDWIERVVTNGDRARAYEMVDRFRTNAAQSKFFKGSRKNMANDPARKDFNMLTKFAGDNGYDSPISAVAAHSRFIKQQIQSAIVDRGNRAGAWRIDVNAERGISETYGQARLWDRAKIIAMNSGDDIPPFVRIAARFPDPNVEEDALTQAWNLYHHFRDAEGEFSNFEFRGATGAPDSSKAVTLGHLPTNAFIDFLENDANALTTAYINRSARSVVPREHFDSPEWTKVYDERIAAIHQEAQDKITDLQGLSPEKFASKQAEILNRTSKDVANLKWALDRALGVPEPQAGIVGTIKRGMSGMMLGRSLNANFGDLGNGRVVDGIQRVFVGLPIELVAGIKRAIADPSVPGGINYESAKRLGVIQRHSTYNAMNDGMNAVVEQMDKQRINTFEKATQWFADTTHVWSGMKAFNDAGRWQFATDINDTLIKYLKGTGKLNERQFTDFNRFGLATNLDDPMTTRIAEQISKHGKTMDGIDYPEPHTWDDRQAAEHFIGFNKRAINTYVLEPDATTKMLIERGDTTSAGFFSAALQFTAFIRAAVDKQMVPAWQRGPGEMLAWYMKLAAWNFTGAYTWELMYGKEDINDEKVVNKIWARAINNTTLLPSSLMMTALKVVEPTMGTASEWLGLTKPTGQRKEVIPLIGGVARIYDNVKGAGQIAMDDGSMSDDKKQKILMSSSQMLPILNTAIPQTLLALINRYQKQRDSQ